MRLHPPYADRRSPPRSGTAQRAGQLPGGWRRAIGRRPARSSPPHRAGCRPAESGGYPAAGDAHARVPGRLRVVPPAALRFVPACTRRAPSHAVDTSAGPATPARGRRASREPKSRGRPRAIGAQRSAARMRAKWLDGRSTRAGSRRGGPRSRRSPSAFTRRPADSSVSITLPAVSGTSTATGRPRSVTSMRSPRLARRTAADAFCCSSRTPIRFMCGNVAQVDRPHKRALRRSCTVRTDRFSRTTPLSRTSPLTAPPCL